MANNINETSFLESQRARTENLGGHRREKTERLHAFWASLKKYLSAWNERLQELDTGQASPLSLTDEADKRRVHLKLSELADELKELRKTCLSSTTTPTAIVVQATENINAASRAQRELLSMIVPPPADELPATDLRLLHRDFSQCQTNLDACRNRLLPKGKFVFGRYRQALLQKQVAAALLEGHETTTHKRRGTTSACGPDTCSPAATDSVARMKEAVENLKTTLQDLVNVRAVVHADGRVEITSKATLDLDKDDSSLAGRQGRIVHQLGDGTGQLVVRNLRDCTVTL